MLRTGFTEVVSRVDRVCGMSLSSTVSVFCGSRAVRLVRRKITSLRYQDRGCLTRRI